MASVPALEFSDFTSLPYSIQEHIVDLVDHYETYLALAVTCKYLSELCVRSLYHTLEFSASDIGEKRWPGMLRSVQFNYVRLLQSVYVQTLEAKPELAAFTQHLTWDLSDDRSWPLAKDMPVSRLWSTFEPLTAVRTLSLRSDVLSYTSGPSTALFPNVVQARIEGTFPQNALGQILFTSPYLKHLAIAPDTKEYQHRPGSSHAYGTGIEPFLRASISERAFRGLRTLEIALDSGVNPSLAVQFMSISAERIEDLRVAYNFGEPLTAFENWVMPMLATGTWRRLRKLALPRLTVPNDAEQRLRKYCPALAIVCCDQ